MLTVGTHFSHGFAENALIALGAMRVEEDGFTGLPLASLRWWHPLTWGALWGAYFATAWQSPPAKRWQLAAEAWDFYRAYVW